MKVLAAIVTPPAYRSSGGVAAGLELTRHLVGKVSIEAAVMAQADGSREDGGLTVREFGCINALGPLRHAAPRQLATSLWRSAIPAYVTRTRPDVVHLHNPMPPLALWAIARACLAARIPYVISSHGFVEMTSFRAAFGLPGWTAPAVEHLITRPFERAVAGAAAICMLSPEENALLDGLRVPAERRAVVTNGVSAYYAEPAPTADLEAVRARFALRGDVPTFLFVGNHTRNKGLDVVLQAVHLVRTPVRVVVAGAIRSPQAHAALCRAHGIDPDRGPVTFTDHVTAAELRALYQSVDAFVFPSRADTLPLVVLEAMVSRLPVVASSVGGIPYQVTPDTGLLVPPDAPERLAEAMRSLALDPARRRAMGERGRARAYEIFSWEAASVVATEVYRRVLARVVSPPSLPALAR